MRITTAKTSHTVVPNEFIDGLMTKTNGEYVKVYLYMLRHAGEDVSEEDIADALDLTCRDVKRAITFLNDNGVFGEVAEEQAEADKTVKISTVQDDEEFKVLLYELQCYMGKTFTAGDADIVAYMYKGMGMQPELIEYLFEVCRAKNKTSLRYIEKVAQGWQSRGIKTVEDAKKDEMIFAEELNSVKRSFGLNSRDLASTEMEIVLKWIREYRMSGKLIEEACKRTILNTGKPTFSYADSILQAWRDKNITSVQQLEKLDSEHKAVSKAARNNQKTKTADNRFHNFEERKESLDEDVLKKFNDLVK